MYANNIQDLNVNFYDVKNGWILYEFSAEKQSLKTRFSDFNYPLQDLKKWLEAISIGVQQTSFQYDDEGKDIKFNFERVTWDRDILTISDPISLKNVYIKIQINKKQVVSAFYNGLLNFASSEKWNSEEWEIKYIHDILCAKLSIDKETLINKLISLDNKELRELIFSANPNFYFSYSKDKNIIWNEFVQMRIKSDDNIIDNEIINEQAIIDTCDLYNNRTPAQKIKFVLTCINCESSSHIGMKISDFKSPIIEKFLGC